MNPQILILPNWQNSSAAHWQSLWEEKFKSSHHAQRVMQHDWMRPLRGDCITRLEDYLLSNVERFTQDPSRLEFENAMHLAPPASSSDIVFVAHSLGCHLVSAWAVLSKHTHRIRSALLVAPPDAMRKDFPLELHSWRKPVLQTLPSRSSE